MFGIPGIVQRYGRQIDVRSEGRPARSLLPGFTGSRSNRAGLECGALAQGALFNSQHRDSMATAKKSMTKAPAKKAATAKKAVKATTPSKPAAVKPINTAFNRTSLITHLAELAAVEIKAVRAIMASLEATILASVHKKGLGSFTLPGLLKVNVVNVPAKKKRTGIDPFTKQERVFAAKPATVKIKTRALKKLKDAAL
jgi:Bacterial DNA-binding protein